MMNTKFSFYQCLVLILRLNFVKLVPDEYCLPPLNTSDCGSPPTAVFSYYKAGSRCEIETWRGCPTQNMFENEYHCSHHCIGRLKFYGRERGSSINDLTLTELEEINRILHKIEHIPNKRENRIHNLPNPYHAKNKSPVKNASTEIMNDTTEYDSNEDDKNDSEEESDETTGNHHHSEEDIDERTKNDNIKEFTHKMNDTKADLKANKHRQSEESKESKESEEYDGEEITEVPLTQVPVTGSYEDPITALKLRENKT